MSRSRPRGRSLRRSDDGVSTVVGAVLVFALVIVTLVSIQTKFVPVWDKQRESDQRLQTMSQLATLKGDLDRLTGNTTTVPASNPVTLAHAEGFRFFQGRSALPGAMTFSPPAAGSGMTLNSSALTVFTRNGVSLFGVGETWASVGAGQTLTAVTDILHLRFRIVDPSNAEGFLNFTMTDANGNCAGRIVLQDTVQFGSDNNIQAQIYGPRTPAAATCATNPITIEDWNQKKQLTPAYFYWNAFDANSQFPSVVAAATYPLTLVMDLDGLQGDFTIVYDTNAGGGTVRVGSAGITIPDYTNTMAAGSLGLTLPNQRLPEQAFVFEYGALFLTQPDGAVMAVPPNFGVSNSNGRTQVSWSFPALNGAASQVAGGRAAVVQALPTGSRTFIDGAAPDLTFRIDTAHPEIWRAYWDDKLSAAGLSSSSTAAHSSCSTTVAGPEYTITTTASAATLDIFGDCPNPAETATTDLSLNFQQASLNVVLHPTD